MASIRAQVLVLRTMALPPGLSVCTNSSPPQLYVRKLKPTRSLEPVTELSSRYESTVGNVNGITVSSWKIQNKQI